MAGGTEVLVRFIGDVSSLGASIGKADGMLAGFANKMNAVGQGLSSIGTSLSMYVTVPIAGIGIAAAKSAVDFDKAMRYVNTIALASEEEFQRMGDAVRELSLEIPQSASQIADSIYFILSAGYTEFDEAFKMAEVSARMATAGMTDAETAARAMIATMMAYKFEVSDADRVADILFAGTQRGVFTFEELAQSLGNVVGAASQSGISLEEMVAALVTMSKSGIDAQKATTGLNYILLNTVKRTEQQNRAIERLSELSGVDLVSSFSAAGLETKGLTGVLEDVMKAIDAAGVSLNDVVQMSEEEYAAMAKASEGTGNFMESITTLFPSIWALRGVFALTSGDMETFKGDMAAMTDATGAMGAAYDQAVASTANQWELFKNKVQNVLILFGEQLLPVMNSVMDSLGKLAEKIAEIPPETMQMIIQIGAVVAAMGPALLIIGKVVSGFSSIVTVFSLLGTASAPVVLIIGTIAALLIGLGASAATAEGGITGMFDKIKTAVGPLLETLVNFGKTVLEAIKPIIAVFQNAADTILPQLIDTINLIAGAVGQVITLLAPVVASILQPIFDIISMIIGVFNDVLAAVLPPLMDLIGQIAGVLKGIIETILPPLMEFLKPIFEKIGEMAKTILPAVIGFLSQLLTAAQPLIDTILKVVVQLLDSLGPVIQNILDMIGPMIEKILPPLGEALGAIMDILALAIDTILPPLIDFLTPILELVAQLIAELLPPLVELVNSVIQAAKPLIEEVLTVIGDILDELLPVILDIIQSVLPILIDLLKSVIGVATPLIEIVLKALKKSFENLKPAIDGVITVVKGLLNAFDWLIDKILGPVMDALGKAIDKIGEVIGWLGDHLPWSPAKKGPFRKPPNWGFVFQTLDPALEHATHAMESFNPQIGGQAGIEAAAVDFLGLTDAVTEAAGGSKNLESTLSDMASTVAGPVAAGMQKVGGVVGEMVERIQTALPTLPTQLGTIDWNFFVQGIGDALETGKEKLVGFYSTIAGLDVTPMLQPFLDAIEVLKQPLQATAQVSVNAEQVVAQVVGTIQSAVMAATSSIQMGVDWSMFLGGLDDALAMLGQRLYDVSVSIRTALDEATDMSGLTTKVAALANNSAQAIGKMAPVPVEVYEVKGPGGIESPQGLLPHLAVLAVDDAGLAYLESKMTPFRQKEARRRGQVA